MLPRLAVTLGDPAGIGPEVAVRACADPTVTAICTPVLIGRARYARRAAALTGLPLPAVDEAPGDDGRDPPDARADAVGGQAAVQAIHHALAGIRAGRYAALVTAPINKAALHAAGIQHPGHTELLAEACGVPDDQVVMAMFGPGMAVALITCHVAYQQVPALLTFSRIERCARLLDEALTRRLGRRPRLALLGLNPHAGEDGLFGDEEQRLLAPAAAALRAADLDVSSPLPPDTAKPSAPSKPSTSTTASTSPSAWANTSSAPALTTAPPSTAPGKAAPTPAP
jgi:4-hydroxythreonine-4-phosphate dehydrogenase